MCSEATEPTIITGRDISADYIRALIAEAEVARLHTWDGLLSTLDTHYPAEVFDGSSGDDGPRMLALMREIDRLRTAWADGLHQIRAALAKRLDDRVVWGNDGVLMAFDAAVQEVSSHTT
jgi:hypothetical protein